MPRNALWLGVALGLLALLGCDGGSQQAAAQQESHLKVLSILYGQYLGQHRGQRPLTETEFKKFVVDKGEAVLASFGGLSPETVFVSERDGQPYVVVYRGKSGPLIPGIGTEAVIYERVGVNGKCFAADELGVIEEVDAHLLPAQ